MVININFILIFAHYLANPFKKRKESTICRSFLTRGFCIEKRFTFLQKSKLFFNNTVLKTSRVGGVDQTISPEPASN